jgi:transcriptional regulator with XRE-family HTH domain
MQLLSCRRPRRISDVLDLDAFGAMVRAARERRGWRPIDLALAMGWSGTAPVYRYERGGPHAPRADPDTVNLFAQVLDLEYADRIALLGLAGPLLDTVPFTADEEERLLAAARPGLEAEPHPAFIFDYRWRLLAVNGAWRRLLGLDGATFAGWRDREVTALDLVWDARLGLRERADEVERLGEVQMLRFQLFNRLRRHEAWYRAYPACRAHLPGFAAAWTRAVAALAGPASALDLGAVMRQEVAMRDGAGRRLCFEASQRTVHGAHGLMGVLVMAAADESTGAAVRE